jgi:hypothetical protein
VRRATPRFLAPALLLVAMGGACDSKTASETGSTTPGVEISSSLEGVETLPEHVRWLATVTPEEEVREVEFLVDGRRLWVDEEPPYSYGEDGAYLATTRFYYEPGTLLHFTVRARLDDGRTRKEFVLAEVPPPMEKSKDAPVYGIWGRASPSYISNPPPPGELGPFTSNLNLREHEFWVGRSIDHAFMYELWADERRFHVGLPIFIGSTSAPGGEQGWTFDGAQCPPTGSEGTYEWSWTKGRLVGHFQGEEQFARYLVLEADNEPCAARRRILEGTWEGVD